MAKMQACRRSAPSGNIHLSRIMAIQRFKNGIRHHPSFVVGRVVVGMDSRPMRSFQKFKDKEKMNKGACRYGGHYGSRYGDHFDVVMASL